MANKGWLMAFGLGVAVLAAEAEAQEQGATSEIPSSITWPSSVGEVVFPHGLHAEEFEFPCQDCHHETHAATLDIPHADYFDDFWIDCKACHGNAASPTRPQSCSNCHHPSPVTIADETLSSKVVIHESCWQCHEIGTGSEATQGCGFCHQGPRNDL
jgi:hypothetical protein